MKTTTVLGCAGMAAVLALAGAVVQAPATVAKAVDSTPVTVMNRAADAVPVSLVPANPWNVTIDNQIVGNHLYAGLGQSSKNLNITSVTIANASMAETFRLHFYSANFLPDRTQPLPCKGNDIGIGYLTGRPEFYAMAPPQQTVHLTFPTPVVFPPVNGQVCIGVEELAYSGQPLNITFNGFIQ